MSCSHSGKETGKKAPVTLISQWERGLGDRKSNKSIQLKHKKATLGARALSKSRYNVECSFWESLPNQPSLGVVENLPWKRFCIFLIVIPEIDHIRILSIGLELACNGG